MLTHAPTGEAEYGRVNLDGTIYVCSGLISSKFIGKNIPSSSAANLSYFDLCDAIFT